MNRDPAALRLRVVGNDVPERVAPDEREPLEAVELAEEPFQPEERPERAADRLAIAVAPAAYVVIELGRINPIIVIDRPRPGGRVYRLRFVPALRGFDGLWHGLVVSTLRRMR